MVSFHTFLAAVIFILSHPALITATPSLPEPIIFSGLTRDEFLQKRAEHHGRLAKRAYVLEEIQNEKTKNHDGQLIIEMLSKACVDKWKDDRWRAQRGGCRMLDSGTIPVLDFVCQIPPSVSHAGHHRMNRRCGQNQKCELIQAINYAGHSRNFPYCKDRFAIEKRPGPDIEIPPRYEGWKELPDKDWLVHQDLPSPGTIDFHFQLNGIFNNLKAAWEYRGHWDNGWSFIFTSVGLVSTFSCLGCPKGTLYAETIGYKSIASGFVF